MIAIIDYGMGNLRSVLNAFQYIEEDAYIATNPDDLRNADGVVLPGVGAFGDGIHNLIRLGFVKALEDEILHKGKAFLGICLGMQLLATTGLENGRHDGLNWVKGRVDRIPNEVVNSKLRIPHVGWNEVHFLKKDGLYAGLGELQAFYFTHSYVLLPENPNVVSGIFSYGYEFAASIEVGNIYAMQFHPEKSHNIGLAVIRNWCKKVAGCLRNV